MHKKRLFIISVILLLIVPVAYASLRDFNLPNGFENAFKVFYNVIHNVYVSYGITFILLFMLLYGAFSAGLKRVSAFGGADGLDKSGKLVAISLSLMSTLGIFLFLISKGGPQKVLEQILKPTGEFGILGLGIIFFLIMYYGFRQGEDKNVPLGLIAAGLAMMFAGSIIKYDDMVTLGLILLILGVIGLIFKGATSLVRGGAGGGGGTPGSGPGPGPGPVPTPPHDFTGDLNNINTLETNYDNLYNGTFKTACNNLLQKNYNYLRGLGGYGPVSPPPDASDWQGVFNTTDNINRISEQINRAFYDLNNNPDFARMPPPQVVQYTNLTTVWAGYINRTQNFRNDFINRFVRGDPPAP
jgi:hypothetical protein